MLNKRNICSLGVWDTSVPGINFDKEGVSNYAKIQDHLMQDYPRDEQSKTTWLNYVRLMKKKKSTYDCIIGVSGGTDSSYLLHLAKDYGLKPLAVNLDNGWSTEQSVRNIKLMTSKLNIDLETYVINYNEVKDVLRSYIYAIFPWADAPTDIAIHSVLYKIAQRENIKYIMLGTDFRSEGKQPSEWTYSDSKQLLFIHSMFGRMKLKTYPIMSVPHLYYLSYINNIKTLLPYNYINYKKKEAQKFLSEKYGWEYYGGHHHENTFTKFIISYWLPKKFNIDKRIITYSAQILSGEITREEALNNLKKSPYDTEEMERDKIYVLKKLDITEKDFKVIWNSPNKSFSDYPSYYPLIKKFAKVLQPILGKTVISKPKILYELEVRTKRVNGA